MVVLVLSILLVAGLGAGVMYYAVKPARQTGRRASTIFSRRRAARARKIAARPVRSAAERGTSRPLRQRLAAWPRTVRASFARSLATRARKPGQEPTFEVEQAPAVVASTAATAATAAVVAQAATARAAAEAVRARTAAVPTRSADERNGSVLTLAGGSADAG